MSELFKLLGTISIKNEEANAAMDASISKANELKTALDGTTNSASDASAEIEGVGKSADAANTSMKEASSTSVFWGNMWANVASKAGSAVKRFYEQGNDYNMQLEKYTASFVAAYGGDETKAGAMINELRELDKATPYDFNGILSAANVLRQYQVPLDEIVETLKMLGEVAGGDTSKLYSLSTAYGQTVGFGKLRGQELMQFNNAGASLYAMLTDKYGYDNATLAKMQENGAITADMVREAFVHATSPGGMFYGQMERIMATTYGKSEKFGSDWELFQGKISEPMTDLLGDIYPALSGVVEFLGDNAAETRLGMNVLGGVGGYAALKNLIPSLKGVKLTEFLGNHPLLTVAGLAGLSASYADQKTAEMEERTGHTAAYEKIIGNGDGEYSGWLGEILEMPGDIEYWYKTRGARDSTSAAEKRALLTSALFPSKPAGPEYNSLKYGYATNAIETDLVTGLTAQMATMVGLLEQIAANGRQPIILNTGALVGGIAPALNTALGQIVNRGNK